VYGLYGLPLVDGLSCSSCSSRGRAPTLRKLGTDLCVFVVLKKSAGAYDEEPPRDTGRVVNVPSICNRLLDCKDGRQTI